MKCNEFLKAAEGWTPSQLALMRSDDSAMLAHARECAACGRWLESQCRLSNAMQALRTSTAQLEAGPAVEQAVLRAFRKQEFAAVPDRTAPVVLRLSRIFEIGAYATVAAALVIAIFLGSRLLHDRQTTPPRVQALTTVAPQQRNSDASKNVAQAMLPEAATPETATQSQRVKTRNLSGQESRRKAGQAAMTAPDNEGYVALMLCDPLICSGDAQVIRMELPAAAVSGDSNATQPVLADVVIGEDGLVRAMRIVN